MNGCEREGELLAISREAKIEGDKPEFSERLRRQTVMVCKDSGHSLSRHYQSSLRARL